MKKKSTGVEAHSSVKERLIKHGIQPSAPRLAIAEYVWNTCSHPTAEDVKHEVEENFPMVSLATVYNTLKLFVSKGLLTEVPDFEKGSVRYDCNISPHYHLIDEDTGEMVDLDPSLIKIAPNLSILGESFKISQIEVTLRGKRLSPNR